MAADRLFGKLEGLDDAVRALLRVGDNLDAVLGRAAAAGGEVIAEEVRRRVPVDTGHLRDSLGVRVTLSDQEGVGAVIAPMPGYTWHGHSRGAAKFGFRKKFHDPEKYGWFQERGFRHWLSGRTVPGKKFMFHGFWAARDRATERVKGELVIGVANAVRGRGGLLGRLRGLFGG